MKRFIVSGELMYLIVVLALIISVGLAQAADPGRYDKGTTFSFHFNEDEKDVIDSSGNENNGILGGGDLPEVTEGPEPRFGNAMEFFDGNYVEIPATDTLDTGSEVTIETWIQLRSLKASWSTVYSKNGQSNTAGFHWVYITQDGSVAYQYCNGSAYTALTAPVNWVFDEWTHLAITHKIDGDKGGVVKWYINGEMIQEKKHTDKALEVVGGKASIGTYQSNPDATRYGLNAALDEFRVSPWVKTDDEIMQSMKSLAVDPRQKLADTWGNIKTNWR